MTFILVVSPLNALMPDEIIKQQNVHVQTSTVCASESISNANIQGEQGFVDNLQ